ncbi:unnamed protein product [Peniophora sp. CBMAI 1063]|nr:unnamed protein product [Peniophora sp. CBMAI 1063]
MARVPACVCLLWLFSLIVVVEATDYPTLTGNRSVIDYTTCLQYRLAQVRAGNLTSNHSYRNGGALDSHGHNISDRTKATSIPYDLCVNECGAGPESFDWTIFSTNLSTWLLPWLALVSQLPFGSQSRQQNVLSIFLTVGSPALAAYSLIICVLNWAWVPRAFEGIQYPNVDHAWHVLGSLQHSPLHVERVEGMLASLVVLPENDQWWENLAKGLNYEETWTTAIILQTAWVVIAFILNLVDSFQDGITNNFESSGRGTGTLFLWLLPLVIGWQRLSPRCDYARVRDALERANENVYYVADHVKTTIYRPYAPHESIAFPSPQSSSSLSPPAPLKLRTAAPIPSPSKCQNRFPFALLQCDDDRGASAPIYSDSRLLPWSTSVELVSGAFRIAATVMKEQGINPAKDGQARRRFLAEVSRRIQQHQYRLNWRTLIRRCAIAGVLAIILHWGAIGSALIYAYYTFTSGLGCRAVSFLLYAVVGTFIWLLIVSSSFIVHYAQWLERQRRLPRLDTSRYHLSPVFARRLAKALRILGKVLAVCNAVWIVTSCLFLFSNFYTRCWCDSSVLGRGAKNAFTLIAPDNDDVTQLTNAWVGAIILSLGAVAAFIGFVYMHVEPVPPDPHAVQLEDPNAYMGEGYFPVERHDSEYGVKTSHVYDPYSSPEINAFSPEGIPLMPSSSSHLPRL